MDLFLNTEPSFEKQATGTAMPEDPNQWAQEILQQLYKQVPFISDFQPDITMDKVDSEKGYGFGHIIISHQTESQKGESPDAEAAAGLRKIRIPIVVKDQQLMPLDLMVTDDSRVLPLTESRVRSGIFRPQAFDVTARTPGDQSMIGQLYPPYRQNYGFGGGGVAMNIGMGKEGSALEEYLQETAPAEQEKRASIPEPILAYMLEEKTATLLHAIEPTINDSDILELRAALQDPVTRESYTKNAHAGFCAVRLMNRSPKLEKAASLMASLIKPDVVQLVRAGDGSYLVKEAHSQYWSPGLRALDRASALREFGSKVVLAADTSGAATMVEGADAAASEGDQDMAGMQAVSTPGLYKVQTDDGQELVGYVIPGLIDTDGTPLPISLFTNGSQATVQGDIEGVPVEGQNIELPTADAPSGHGAFFSVMGDMLQATIPMTISASYQGPEEGEPAVLHAETYDGRPVQVSLQPQIQVVMGTEDGKMLVPDSWQWMPLSQAGAVSLVGGDEANKQAQAARTFASVEVVSGGGEYSFRGPAVEKLAESQRQFLDTDSAMFLLGALGVNLDYGIRKLAEASVGHGPVTVKIGRYIRTASEQNEEATKHASMMLGLLPALRRPLFKEAAVITDPEAVDAVLSLGFLNPENITTFVGYLPQLDMAQSKLCEMLFAARVGLGNVPEGAVEKAVRALEEVLEGLKAMAFEGPPSYE